LSVAALHPAIRILVLLFLCIASASASYAQLVFTLLLLSVGFAMGQKSLLFRTFKVFYRLKWLFASILLIYVFLEPGNAQQGHFAGVEDGLIRIFSLLLLIAAVNLLVQSGSPSEFMSGLIWLLSPLQRLGLPTQRVAVRMALTLEMIPRLQTIFQASHSNADQRSIRKDVRHYVASLAALAVERVQLTVNYAEQYQEKEIEILTLVAPRLGQLLFLVLLITCYVALGILV